MGGSGGGFFYQSNDNPPESISKKIRQAEEQTKDQSFEIDTANMLREILTTVNNRDTETIQKHLTTIEKALHKDIEGTINLRYGGSVAKHTYVDGLSDIDSLAIINDSELVNLTPGEVKEYFFERLKSRLPNSEIQMGKLAITVKFNTGVEIQILPAIKTSTGVKIVSSRRQNEWSHLIRPDKFAKALKYMNQSMQGKLVPVIKLAKSLISSLPESRQLAGYHTECLAIEVFKNYVGIKNPKEMLKHFFSEGAKSVLQPIKDKTGQSVHVDDYLEGSNSLKRKMVSDSMATLARKMQNADGSKDKRIWEQILQ